MATSIYNSWVFFLPVSTLWYRLEIAHNQYLGLGTTDIATNSYKFKHLTLSLQKIGWKKSRNSTFTAHSVCACVYTETWWCSINLITMINPAQPLCLTYSFPLTVTAYACVCVCVCNAVGLISSWPPPSINAMLRLRPTTAPLPLDARSCTIRMYAYSYVAHIHC